MHAKSKTTKTVNLALFDFDGTLYPKDSFTRFIFFALPKHHVILKGLKILPWIQAYYLGLYPAHAMRPRLFQTMFKGVTAKQIQSIAINYAQQIIKELDPDLLQQLYLHQQRGDHVVLVSASIDLYLAPICELLNIELICTETEIINGTLSGHYQSLDCSCEQKKIRVLQQYNLNEYHQVYAYGNSHEDLEMFSLTDHAYMVGQDLTLPHVIHPQHVDEKQPQKKLEKDST
ncbi:Phosphoserine phosphatase [Acinetobacter haemolyticus CIP 64.3 = MTCC 9819]|uniref:HAD hydrolase, family IB n=1 Tax=Acinetobacter haemolyticus CIP 64.3 = MTCC 9819 TaxID=1217659 RepID=N9GE59_ACIHA|nr:HAD-IB family hydrolase [Acinetobacter haemolyticus]ENW15461.1 HAD hydrolase, family IB [Acinetobacter haemolyticus CIP 64.3 = MTCC 9819]EPR90212.1 Phosphoserine phosphatase [Acinetobacter haemolyticus CIP 64.3 = MTCC 9819]NAR86266.1 HAD-IB family hydrolase [Acinetobacter haemolyticus]NAS02169.1 HAD-IB family hydrolase [Acinetobacter haemolyticus]QHI17240.1 HAD-IB family hydrolase [Acinetobacter haemolyticus]